jgi:sRNA-binding protein
MNKKECGKVIEKQLPGAKKQLEETPRKLTKRRRFPQHLPTQQAVDASTKQGKRCCSDITTFSSEYQLAPAEEAS